MVKNIFGKLKSNAGYISVETVIVAGLIVALGAYALTEFYATGQSQTANAMDNVNKVLEVNVIETPLP